LQKPDRVDDHLTLTKCNLRPSRPQHSKDTASSYLTPSSASILTATPGLMLFSADHTTLPTLDSNYSAQEVACLPVVRWAGGKRLLVPRLVHYLPASFKRYFEPMVGSGALFFYLQPRRSVLGDLNPELVNFYQVLKARPRQLHRAIARFNPSKTAYYAARDSSPVSSLSRAARFFFLVRLSWNGLYRVNKHGWFNVPFGGRRPHTLVLLPHLLAASSALQTANIHHGDLTDTTRDARRGDLVYFDPPYPRGALEGNGFDRYASRIFRLEDHRRLADHATQLAARGIHVLITEAARKEILNLYPRTFRVAIVRGQSRIASDPADRRKSYEAILTSYRPASKR